MRDRIVKLANEALTGELMLGDNTNWGIDRGNFEGGAEGRVAFGVVFSPFYLSHGRCSFL